MIANATTLVAGRARGPILRLTEPISFWGGVDPESGLIVENRHPQAGSRVTGAILVLPHSRGSSSSPSVLAEMIRASTAPAGVILGQADPMVVLGAVVAAELYDLTMPVVVLDGFDVPNGSEVRIEPEGTVTFH